jgi:hypothetical protein
MVLRVATLVICAVIEQAVAVRSAMVRWWVAVTMGLLVKG